MVKLNMLFARFAVRLDIDLDETKSNFLCGNA